MEHARIAIIGGGFSGLGMAIRLLEDGIDDFVVLERSEEVGGAWRDNTYPGCTCDVPSHLYSFSFDLNPDWSQTFSRQPEIQDYIKRCADRYGVRRHIRFGSEVTAASWDEETSRWTIETSNGHLSAQILIQGTGPFSDPLIPDVPGLDRFDGPAFHSARWDGQGELVGKRVAVVGTGASAVQIVPAIQPDVDRLVLYQRTPPWVVPQAKRKVTRLERGIYRRFPFAQRVARVATYLFRETYVFGLTHAGVMALVEWGARIFLWSQVRDRGLRRKLTPSYRFGCKRMLVSNVYYRTLTKPNVEVVTEGVAEVREHSVVGSGGTEHDVDAIIFATGFHLTDPPLVDDIRGRGGASLGELWRRESMHALRGTTVHGFPNYFLIVGPNTGIGHTSLLVMIESQVGYIAEAVREIVHRGAVTVEARAEAEADYNRYIQKRMRGTVWARGGCRSHYFDARGKIVALYPGFSFIYRRGLRRFDRSEYEFGYASEGEESNAIASELGGAQRTFSGSSGTTTRL